MIICILLYKSPLYDSFPTVSTKERKAAQAAFSFCALDKITLDALWKFFYLTGTGGRTAFVKMHNAPFLPFCPWFGEKKNATLPCRRRVGIHPANSRHIIIIEGNTKPKTVFPLFFCQNHLIIFCQWPSFIKKAIFRRKNFVCFSNEIFCSTYWNSFVILI